MFNRVVLPALITLGALLGALTPVQAQGPSLMPPFVASSGQQEAKVTPDRATINIAVQTTAKTAAAAGQDNANKQNKVLAALRSLGLTNDQLSTTGFSVQPQYRYLPNKDPELTGYEVVNTIVADIRDTKQVGKVIDAALGAGANQISSLNFYASNTDAARQQAIATAVVKAKAEAQAAATAAGGSLGELLEMSVEGGSVPPPRPVYYAAKMAGASDMASTAINPGDQTLTVSVSTRWKFVQGNR